MLHNVKQDRLYCNFVYLLHSKKINAPTVKKSSTKTVCDTSDVTSGFLNIDKRNKFHNMAAPTVLTVSPLKLLILKHKSICFAKKI